MSAIAQMKESNLFVPQALGKLRVIHEGREFFVIDSKGVRTSIQRTDLSQNLRGVDWKTLEKMVEAGTLRLNRRGQDYALTYQCRGMGGGPVAGAIAYWVTKTVCYGVAIAGAGTAVVATGGAVGAATGAIAAAGTLGASAGASIVGGAIAGSGLAAEAATATAGVIAGAGSIAAAAAAVESASMSVGALFAMLPIP